MNRSESLFRNSSNCDLHEFCFASFGMSLVDLNLPISVSFLQGYIIMVIYNVHIIYCETCQIYHSVQSFQPLWLAFNSLLCWFCYHFELTISILLHIFYSHLKSSFLEVLVGFADISNILSISLREKKRVDAFFFRFVAFLEFCSSLTNKLVPCHGGDHIFFIKKHLQSLKKLFRDFSKFYYRLPFFQ